MDQNEMAKGQKFLSVIGFTISDDHNLLAYLVDTTGSGNWMRRDPLDDGVRVPMWPLYIFE